MDVDDFQLFFGGLKTKKMKRRDSIRLQMA
jgi:hypothetical protein